MNFPKTKHSKIIIEITASILSPCDNRADQLVSIEISGCIECVKNGIATSLLENAKFKEIINGAVRIANEVRSSKNS
jgi:hypothetical protein